MFYGNYMYIVYYSVYRHYFGVFIEQYVYIYTEFRLDQMLC